MITNVRERGMCGGHFGGMLHNVVAMIDAREADW